VFYGYSEVSFALYCLLVHSRFTVVGHFTVRLQVSISRCVFCLTLRYNQKVHFLQSS